MNRITKEVKIAVVAILGIAILFFGMNFLKGFVILSNDSSYTIVFKQLDGLSVSSPIFADGYKVGVVRSIEYDYENRSGINVQVDLDKNLRVPVGTVAEVHSDLMGNVQVDLVMPDNYDGVIKPGEKIVGRINGGALGELSEMVPTIKQIIPKLDSILASVNALLADPAIASILHNTDDITTKLNATASEVNVLMQQINKDVPSMMNKADFVLANAGSITENISKIDVAATMAKVDEAVENVNELTRQLNSKEGTLGLFLHDPGLYNNMNDVMRNADSLVIDLKSRPSRYVHFSVFGKKDK